MVSLFHFIALAALVQGLAFKPDSLMQMLHKKDTVKALKLDFDVERTYTLANTTKRDADGSLTNERDVRYNMDVYLGSDKQKVTVEIDTGSSDLWVRGAGAGESAYGTFDSSTSTTFSNTYLPFYILYEDGTSARGSFVEDTITLGDGTSMNSFQFALASTVTNANQPAILGISRKVEEASLFDYDNFPYALVDAGIIEKPSYSIYLNGDKGETGVVLFGGIDEAKYSGELVTFPIVDSTYASIELESISVNGKNYTLNRHAQFDTGTSWLFLPKDIVLDVAKLLGGDTCEDCSARSVPCEQPTDKFMTFDFGQQQISLSYADLVVNPLSSGCFLGMSVAEDGANGNNLIMGDVLLRHTYTYFDFENNVIAIAPSVDTNASNIVQA